MPPSTDDIHAELRGVTVRRAGRELIHALDLGVRRGEFVAVTGPSGAGKSSLLACLADMLPPAEGAITFRGADQRAHTPATYARHIGFIFQHLRLSANASVLTNVLCGALGRHPWWRTLLGFPRADRARAHELVAAMELSGYEHTSVRRISGGEKQRTAIARTLLQSPELILADEPVASLDPRLARQILARLRDEGRAAGRTVFCVLHDPKLVAEFADVVLTLDRDSPSAWSVRSRAHG